MDRAGTKREIIQSNDQNDGPPSTKRQRQNENNQQQGSSQQQQQQQQQQQGEQGQQQFQTIQLRYPEQMQVSKKYLSKTFSIHDIDYSKLSNLVTLIYITFQ